MEGRAKLPALRARIAAIPASAASAPYRDAVALGLAPIDARLPGGGLARAAIHAVCGGGAYGLLAVLLGRLPGSVVWCRQAGADTALYPHGLRAQGLDPTALIVAHAPSVAGLLGSAEEALRSGAVDAVVAELPGAVGLTSSRRLQLAAQAGGAMGFLLLADGPARTGGFSATTAWQAETVPSPAMSRLRWRLELVRCRNGRPGTWTVEWDAKTACLAVVSQAGDGPARPAARRQVAE